jgi:hypothetical protein
MDDEFNSNFRFQINYLERHLTLCLGSGFPVVDAQKGLEGEFDLAAV